MHIPGTPFATIQPSVSSSDIPILPSIGGDEGGGLKMMLMGAFEQCGVDQDSMAGHLASAGILSDAGMVLKDAGMGMWSLKNAVSSFSSWMSSDSYINDHALMTLSHGLNGVTLLAKTGGDMLGQLGSYTGATSAFINASKVYTGLQEGNVSQVVFSGAKLCAAVALSGVPAAGAALSAAEFAYNYYK